MNPSCMSLHKIRFNTDVHVQYRCVCIIVAIDFMRLCRIDESVKPGRSIGSMYICTGTCTCMYTCTYFICMHIGPS